MSSNGPDNVFEQDQARLESAQAQYEILVPQRARLQLRRMQMQRYALQIAKADAGPMRMVGPKMPRGYIKPDSDLGRQLGIQCHIYFDNRGNIYALDKSPQMRVLRDNSKAQFYMGINVDTGNVVGFKVQKPDPVLGGNLIGFENLITNSEGRMLTGLDITPDDSFMIVTPLESTISFRAAFAQKKTNVEKFDMLEKLLQTVDAMHQRGNLHRNIKPYEIGWDDHEKQVFMIDFGHSRQRAGEDGNYEPQTPGPSLGRSIYFDPLLMKMERSGFRQNPLYSPSTDLYSIGVTMITLLRGEGFSQEQLKQYEMSAELDDKLIKKGENPKHVADMLAQVLVNLRQNADPDMLRLIDVIQLIIDPKPENRPTISEVIAQIRVFKEEALQRRQRLAYSAFRNFLVDCYQYNKKFAITPVRVNNPLIRDLLLRGASEDAAKLIKQVEPKKSLFNLQLAAIEANDPVALRNLLQHWSPFTVDEGVYFKILLKRVFKTTPVNVELLELFADAAKKRDRQDVFIREAASGGLIQKMLDLKSKVVTVEILLQMAVDAVDLLAFKTLLDLKPPIATPIIGPFFAQILQRNQVKFFQMLGKHEHYGKIWREYAQTQAVDALVDKPMVLVQLIEFVLADTPKPNAFALNQVKVYLNALNVTPSTFDNRDHLFKLMHQLRFLREIDPQFNELLPKVFGYYWVSRSFGQYCYPDLVQDTAKLRKTRSEVVLRQTNNPANTEMVIDIAGCLLADGKFNTDLISALASSGVKDVYLYHSQAHRLLENEAGNAEPYNTDGAIELLKQFGIEVKGVLSNADVMLNDLRHRQLPSGMAFMTQANQAEFIKYYAQGRKLSQEEADHALFALRRQYEKFCAIAHSKEGLPGQFYANLIQDQQISGKSSSDYQADPKYMAMKFVYQKMKKIAIDKNPNLGSNPKARAVRQLIRAKDKQGVKVKRLCLVDDSQRNVVDVNRVVVRGAQVFALKAQVDDPQIKRDKRHYIRRFGALFEKPPENISSINQVDVAPFKENAPPYGGFVNRTPAWEYPVVQSDFPVIQVIEGESYVAQQALPKIEGLVHGGMIEWPSAEHAYQGQKLLEIHRLLTLQIEFYPSDQALLSDRRVIEKMLLELIRLPSRGGKLVSHHEKGSQKDTLRGLYMAHVHEFQSTYLGVNRFKSTNQKMDQFRKHLNQEGYDYRGTKNLKGKYQVPYPFQYMKQVMRDKMRTHPELRLMAMDFARRGIFPINSADHRIWGTGKDGKGDNLLGAIILELGMEFIEQTEPNFQFIIKNPVMFYFRHMRGKNVEPNDLQPLMAGATSQYQQRHRRAEQLQKKYLTEWVDENARFRLHQMQIKSPTGLKNRFISHTSALGKHLGLRCPVFIDVQGNIFAINEARETKLGAGSYGQVFVGVDLSTGDTVAIKIQTPREQSQSVYRELNTLDKLGELISSISASNSAIILSVMKLEKGTSVSDEMAEIASRTNKKGQTHDRLYLALEFIKEVEKFHQAGYLHRDIKPENMMWDKARRKAKLIDYGLAIKRGKRSANDPNPDPYEAQVRGKWGGTPYYMAPELDDTDSKGETDFSVASEVYAVGVSLIEMFGSLRIYTQLGLHAARMVKRMTSSDPRERPSLQEVAEVLKKVKQDKELKHFKALWKSEQRIHLSEEDYLNPAIMEFVFYKIGKNSTKALDRLDTRSQRGLIKVAIDSKNLIGFSTLIDNMDVFVNQPDLQQQLIVQVLDSANGHLDDHFVSHMLHQALHAMGTQSEDAQQAFLNRLAISILAFDRDLHSSKISDTPELENMKQMMQILQKHSRLKAYRGANEGYYAYLAAYQSKINTLRGALSLSPQRYNSWISYLNALTISMSPEQVAGNEAFKRNYPIIMDRAGLHLPQLANEIPPNKNPNDLVVIVATESLATKKVDGTLELNEAFMDGLVAAGITEINLLSHFQPGMLADLGAQQVLIEKLAAKNIHVKRVMFSDESRINRDKLTDVTEPELKRFEMIYQANGDVQPFTPQDVAIARQAYQLQFARIKEVINQGHAGQFYERIVLPILKQHTSQASLMRDPMWIALERLMLTLKFQPANDASFVQQLHKDLAQNNQNLRNLCYVGPYDATHGSFKAHADQLGVKFASIYTKPGSAYMARHYQAELEELIAEQGIAPAKPPKPGEAAKNLAPFGVAPVAPPMPPQKRPRAKVVVKQPVLGATDDLGPKKKAPKPPGKKP